MKTIEPNTDSDLIDRYTQVQIEFIQFLKTGEKEFKDDFEAIQQGYENLIVMLEKNIKQRGLLN